MKELKHPNIVRFERFFEDGCAFCVPLGGTVEMAYAFQRALEKRDGERPMMRAADSTTVPRW